MARSRGLGDVYKRQRQYDPRRIIREALADEVSVAPNATSLNQPKTQTQPKLAAGEQAPFDAEAT
jgi:sec-independent protein translocase protein TatB